MPLASESRLHCPQQQQELMQQVQGLASGLLLAWSWLHRLWQQVHAVLQGLQATKGLEG
jgi:hypothetical protein